MGSSTSAPSKQPSINLEDYQEVVNNNIDTYYIVPNRRIIRNKFTNLELEQYNMEFANQDEMNKYYEVFYWRMTQENIARTLHFWITKQAECCSHMCRAKVYTERVLIRLSDIKDIPYPDNLYMLLASADAFDKIVQKIGFFDIQQNMIGVNSNGQIRVWINQDLSSNTIDIDSYQCKTEKQMAKRLVSMINENTQLESEPSSFLKYVNSRCSNLSFYDLMVLVRQYAKIHKTSIPTNFSAAIDAVKCDPSYTERSIQSQHSVSRFSHRQITKNYRNREIVQPIQQPQLQPQPQQQYYNHIGNNIKQIKYIPSITKLTNCEAKPTYTRIPSFLTPVQKNSSNNFQKKYLIQNPTRYQISESRKVINPIKHLTPSMSKVSPISTSPISNYSSPVRNKQQFQTARKITQKTQNTNNYTGESKSSFRFLRTDRKTNESSQKTPSNYKLISKLRDQYLPTSSFSQNKQLIKQYYNYRPQIAGIDRIPSVQTKLHEYFQTSPATTHDKQMSSYKSKIHNQKNIRNQFSNQKNNFSFQRKGGFKEKYQMDPQIAHDLIQFYQNH